jgi:hypothetical protein
MATKNTKKAKGTKSLKKAKKLEATKPLVSLNYSKIQVSY